MGKPSKSKKQDSAKREKNAARSKPSALADPLRFCLLFLLYLAGIMLAYIAIQLLADRLAAKVLLSIIKTVAVSLSALLNLLGFRNILEGSNILLSGLSLEIVLECTGIYETFILWAAVLAYPVRWKYRALGILLSAVFIYLLNILRMTILALVGMQSSEAFELAHLYFLRISSIFLIIFSWIFWLTKMVKYEQKTSNLRG